VNGAAHNTEGAVEWMLNKQNKIPLYLQLKDLIKYSISTGALQQNERLPTVHALAKHLAVNFETVRKAYKDLQHEGLVSTDRGIGTFVTSPTLSGLSQQPNPHLPGSTANTLKESVHQLLRAGRTKAEIDRMVARFAKEYRSARGSKVLLFTECNTRQATEMSNTLREYLGLDVRPVLVTELSTALERAGDGVSIITTGFHMKDVRQIVGSRRIPIYFVASSMSPQTRRKIEAFPKTARFGFVCRDVESRNFYREVLRAEFAIESPINACLLSEKAKFASLLKSVDVLLVTPSVLDQVEKLAPPKLPLFNINDRVDPMSLRGLRDSLLSARPK
jgi:DNA-binding transcriptional regulator YhcF (GntR family)